MNTLIRKFTAAGLILILVLAAFQGCKKEREIWKPEAFLVIKPDSGLTTQIFDFGLDIINTPHNPQEYFVRWDMTGDSVWDAPFSATAECTHRFYQKGTHTVRAEILTEGGQRVFLSREINVAQGYSAPHASFTITPPIGNFLMEYTFDASATFDDEDSVSTLKYRWDFEDDGGWDTDYTDNPIVKTKYKKPGLYSIRLSVMDPTRRTASVTNNLPVNLFEEMIKPDFTWTPLEGTVKDTFSLDASATRHETDPERVFSYKWDIINEVTYGPFNDPIFLHRFWTHGMQKITLTVTDQHGLYNSCTREFFVIKENKPPVPAIRVSTPYGNITTQFYLDAWNSLDDVTPPSEMLIRWDFEGDGEWDTGWSKEKFLFHQYPAPGDYWVTLQAQDEGDETGTAKTLVKVSPYSAQTSFFIDKRDGKYYGTVKIGNQWWMSDNLDYRTNPKMDIPMLQICFDEESGRCDQYGSLYQGERSSYYIREGHRICPDGWRVPSRGDWLELQKQVPASGGRDAMLVGGNLGFNARYTGFADYYFQYDLMFPWIIVDTIYKFHGHGQEVQFLSTTTRPHFNRTMAQFYMGVMNRFDGVDFSWGNTDGFFYIRCIKDE